MPYLSTELIADAYYSSGIVSREFETVNGEQITSGLKWLNNIITEKTVDDSMVPYESVYTFTASVGVEIYPIPNLISINTLVFFLDSVRYAMKYEKRNAYFGSSRVENINTLPFMWYWERQFGGGNLYIYFKPDRNYPIELHGIFRLLSVSLFQDLSLTLDEFYTTYLKYSLADRLCSEYNYSTPDNVVRQLSKYEALIDKKSKLLDLSVSKVSTLQKRGSLNYGFINLGKGWVVPS